MSETDRKIVGVALAVLVAEMLVRARVYPFTLLRGPDVGGYTPFAWEELAQLEVGEATPWREIYPGGPTTRIVHRL